MKSLIIATLCLCAIHSQAQASLAVQAQRLSNKDVVAMVQAGISADVVITKMRASDCDFNTDPQALTKLRKAGVPDKVLKEMILIQSAGPRAQINGADAIRRARANPQDFDAQMAAGSITYQAQQFDDALEFYQRAGELKPAEVEPVIQLGNVNYDAGRYEAAEKYYIAALVKAPENVNVRTDLGLTFLLREPPQYDRAITEFRHALERDPRHEQTLQNMVVALTGKGDKDEGRATLKRLQTLNPDNPDLTRLQADLDSPDAQPVTAAAAASPRDFDLQMNAAAAFYKAGDYDKAELYLKRALAAKPKDVDALTAMGNTLYDKGDFAGAAAYYQRVLTIKPKNTDVRTDLGNTYFRRTPPDYARAIAEYRKALAIDPQNEKALQNLAAAALQLKDKATARVAIDKLAVVNPVNPVLAALREQLRALP